METILGIFLFSFTVSAAEISDGKDYSNFQMMEKIVEIEHDHKVMHYLLGKYRQLEDTNMETAKILQSQAEMTRVMDKRLQETWKILESQETLIESIKETLSTAVEKLETQSDEQMEKLAKIEVKIMSNEEDIEKLKTEDHVHATAITSLKTSKRGVGSTYVRWGRPDCPENGTNLIYSGLVGGSHLYDTGAAANHLCLTNKPKWAIYDDHYNGETNLYGAEYRFSAASSQKFFGKNLHNHDVPCAVCRSSRSSAFMLPGSYTCADGWTKEYDGFLVAGHHKHPAAAEFICLDSNSVPAHGSSVKLGDRKLMYIVETPCKGPLKCPPYVANREVSCVVCTK